ncbi:MAG: ATP-binding cassette domain-containing protein, partial [Burkholderiaceae bacterium]
MSEIVLRVRGLHVAYGGIQAVKGIDLEVGAGELVTLIGANGAGKTTTLKAITGTQAWSG